MVHSMLQLEIWLVAVTVLALGALAISVAAFFTHSVSSEKIDDLDNQANQAAEMANRAHEIVTGYTLDEVDVYGRHHNAARMTDRTTALIDLPAE